MKVLDASDIFRASEELMKFIDSEKRYFSIDVDCWGTYGRTRNYRLDDTKSLIEVLVSRGKVLNSLTFRKPFWDQLESMELLDCIRHARAVIFKNNMAGLMHPHVKSLKKLVDVLERAESLTSLTFVNCGLTEIVNLVLAPHLKIIDERAKKMAADVEDAETLDVDNLWSLNLGEMSRSKDFKEFRLYFESLEKYGDQLSKMLAGTEILVDALVKSGKELYGMVFKNCTHEIMRTDEVLALFKNIKHIKALLHFEDTDLGHSTTVNILRRHTTEHQLIQPESTVNFIRCNLQDKCLIFLRKFMASVPMVTLEENPTLTREGVAKLIAFYRSTEGSGKLYVKGTTEDLSDLDWDNNRLFHYTNNYDRSFNKNVTVEKSGGSSWNL